MSQLGPFQSATARAINDTRRSAPSDRSGITTTSSFISTGFAPYLPRVSVTRSFPHWVRQRSHAAGSSGQHRPGQPPTSLAERADELGDALGAAFGHDGPALIDVRTARHELSLPPKVSFGQLKGFTLDASRTILSGGGSELLDLAKTNLRELEVE